VTELLPVLMTDIINNAPHDQKVRTRHASVAWAISNGVSLYSTSATWFDLLSWIVSLTYHLFSNRKKSRNSLIFGSVAKHSPPPCCLPSERSSLLPHPVSSPLQLRIAINLTTFEQSSPLPRRDHLLLASTLWVDNPPRQTAQPLPQTPQAS
jgi:hypothetical protein